MGDTPLYLLRLLQYLALMLLFGLPLMQWLAERRSHVAGTWDTRSLRRWLLAFAIIALALGMVELPLKTMRIMWLSLAELDSEALAWYLLDTPTGWAWLARTVALLYILGLLVGWPRSRNLPWAALCIGSGIALTTLLWNGHAAASTGLPGLLRLGLGGLHLLAAAVWLGAIAGFLMMLGTGWQQRNETGTLRQWHARLHDFVSTGSLLVAILLFTGILHYAWIDGWHLSTATLLQTAYGRWMLFKIALFACMLGLAALHRWILVPRLLNPDTAPGDTRHLRRSLRIEAALAVLIIAAVAILGTMSPHA